MFLGWSAGEIAAADDLAWEQVHERLHDWAQVMRNEGVASLLEAITVAERLPERALIRPDGERLLTDVRHLGQLLHAAAASEGLGITALAAWLRRRIREAPQDSGDEERSRRLESDADAVQVLTIHRSKGLEFPIVYLPFLWDGRRPAEGEPVTFHDAAAGHARTIDVGLAGKEFKEHREQAIREERGEDLRLAYVALTRARHQAIVWWAGSWDSRSSALTRLVFARQSDGTVDPYGDPTPDDAFASARFRDVAAQAPGAITVERSTSQPPLRWSPPLPEPGRLDAAQFTRVLDRRWRRTSYTDLTAAAHDAASELVTSESEQPVVDDEWDLPAEAPVPGPDPELTPAPSLLAELPPGTTTGTLVHRVLQDTDFAAEDLEAELSAALEAALARRAVSIADRVAVVGVWPASSRPRWAGASALCACVT